MAKGIATEDELSAGIRSVGVLSAVAAPERGRRDNPFAVPAARPTSTPSDPAIASPAREHHSLPDTVASVPETSPEGPPQPPIVAPASESDRYTDHVTVPMTADMRTRASLLAARLQRQRTERKGRFTPNSVFRVAIEMFLKHFELNPGDCVNSENELLSVVDTRVGAIVRASLNKSP